MGRVREQGIFTFAEGHPKRGTIPTLVSGVALMAGLLASSGAQAQCSAGTGIEYFPFGAGSGLNALTSIISTVNTAFLNNGSAFVSAPSAGADQIGGGAWVRTVGGTVETKANTNFSGSFVYNGATNTASGSCHTKVAEDFAGFQAGQDIALLNSGNSGMNWHVGLMAGVVGSGFHDQTPGSGNGVPPTGTPSGTLNGNFEVPFAGVYSAFSKGNFFADVQGRFDYYQAQLNDPNANSIYNQRIDARGFSLTANAGYRFDLGSNWNLEPSVGAVFSRAWADQFDVVGSYAGTYGGGGSSYPGAVQINRLDSELGRATVKLGTSVSSDDGRIVAYPFVVASVFHEFAGNATATVSGTGTYPVDWGAAGSLTTSRIGTYGQLGVGSAFQLADTGWLGYARVDYRTGDNIQGLSVNAGLRYQLNPDGTTSSSLKDGAAKAYDWTGPYVGASVGSTWGNEAWTAQAPYTSRENVDFAGYLGALQAGYNYQVGRFVWGAEGEFGLSGARGGRPSTGALPELYSSEADVSALGMLTGRFGYTWGPALVYAKGGVAFGDVTAGGHLNIPWVNGTYVGNTGAETKWEQGWTYGGGMEVALSERWSAKAEYMHYDLGKDTFLLQQAYTDPNTGNPVAATKYSVPTEGNLVQVGVNYHLGRTDSLDDARVAGLKDGSVYAPNVWTGFYVGVHTGGASSVSKVNDPYPAYLQKWLNDQGLGGFLDTPNLFGDTVRSSGPLEGFQAGINYQIGRIAAGLEADASFAQIDGTNTCLAASGWFYSSNCHVRVDAMGTFTARLGTTFGENGRTLAYAKAGVAWEQINAEMTANYGPYIVTPNPSVTTGFNGIKLGWTVGAGVEHALTPRWSVKAEYDYLNFGSIDLVTPPSWMLGMRVPAQTASMAQDMHQVKLGLNYKLGGADEWSDSGSTKDVSLTAVPAWEFEMGTRYASTWGRFHRDIGILGADPRDLASRITYDGMNANGGEQFARIDTPNNIMIKGYAGIGKGSNGQQHDEDWGISGILPYSNTVSDVRSNGIKYGALDVGYDVFREAGYRVSPFVGYSIMSQSMKAYGCSQIGNPWSDCVGNMAIPTSQMTMTEDDTWQAVRVGAAADFALTPRLKLSVDAAYLPYVSFKGMDNHVAFIFPNGSHELLPQAGTGNGVQIEASLSYAVTDNLSLGIGGRYLAESVTGTNGFMNLDNAGNPDGTYTKVPQKTAVEQATGFAQISYHFGTAYEPLK
jgi:outer membrane autotransporter protein